MYGIQLLFPLVTRLSGCWSNYIRITEVDRSQVRGIDDYGKEFDIHMDWLDGPTDEDLELYRSYRKQAEHYGLPPISRQEETALYHLSEVARSYREEEDRE